LSGLFELYFYAELDFVSASIMKLLFKRERCLHN